jgi:hypothetical protein
MSATNTFMYLLYLGTFQGNTADMQMIIAITQYSSCISCVIKYFPETSCRFGGDVLFLLDAIHYIICIIKSCILKNLHVLVGVWQKYKNRRFIVSKSNMSFLYTMSGNAISWSWKPIILCPYVNPKLVTLFNFHQTLHYFMELFISSFCLKQWHIIRTIIFHSYWDITSSVVSNKHHLKFKSKNYGISHVEYKLLMFNIPPIQTRSTMRKAH